MRTILDRLADLSVVGSFSRLGYSLRAPTFEDADLAVDLSGRVMVVTGATSGIGLAIAQAFHARGATVVLVGRSADKLARAAQTVGERALTERADLGELDEVADLAQRLLQRFDKVHALVLNAGLLVNERQLTRGGHERAFATHVLGAFALAQALRPALARAARPDDPARVVWVSSGGMYTQKLDWQKCQALTGRYDGVEAYAQQKRAQVILSELMATAFHSDHITSNAMHPGWAHTPGVETGLPKFTTLMRPLLRTAEQGADTAVWLAASPACKLETGKFWLDRQPRRTDLLTRHGADEKSQLYKHVAALVGAARPTDARGI